MTTEIIENITHQATVKSVDPKKGTLTVTLKHDDDCSSCPVTEICGGANSDTLTLQVAHPERFRPGERVELTGTERMHPKAVKMATIVPCIALVAAMVGIYLASGDQFAAVAGGLGVMVFFFAMLYAFRNKIRHEFSFEVRKASQQRRS